MKFFRSALVALVTSGMVFIAIVIARTFFRTIAVFRAVSFFRTATLVSTVSFFRTLTLVRSLIVLVTRLLLFPSLWLTPFLLWSGFLFTLFFRSDVFCSVQFFWVFCGFSCR